MIYLDHAATSMHKPIQVYDAVSWAMRNCASLGRSGHEAANLAADVAFRCRLKAAELFDARADCVVFTSNATHGLNIAIQSLVQKGDRVVVSGFEHNAVLRPLKHLGAEIIVAGRKLFDPDDTLQSFRSAVDQRTKAVICTHVSNVFGYILPIKQIAEICGERGVPLILDASQSAGNLPVSMKELNATFIAMPGHKGLLGPQGTGLLLCERKPKPIIFGGTGSNSLSLSMPDFLPDMAEAGTHNIPGIAGLLAAMEYLQTVKISNILRKEQELAAYLLKRLQNVSGIRTYYSDRNLQTGVLSIQFLSADCEVVAASLAADGIAVRSGLHCSPMAHQSVGTLETGTLRVSFSSENSFDEIDIFIHKLRQIIV